MSTTETTRPTPARARGTRQDTPQIPTSHPLPAKRTKTSGCPFARTLKSSSHSHKLSIPSQHLISTNPTWADNISSLFAQPYWLPAGEREKVGSDWIAAMQYWGANVDLSTFEDAKTKAVPIYTHLAARSMPLTDDPSHYFPDEALEIFRAWVNQGCRKTLQDPIVEKIIIPTPSEPVLKLRIRKDLRNLTPTELQEYRAKIDDVLGAGLLNSKWQELGFLHAEWCLHYQEATFLWHRAYLRYVEELIDFPIPYWNCFAIDTSDPNSPFAGLPKEYLEENYTHPSGEMRKNPLKYALSLDGLSKTKKSPYVTRYPVLVDGASSPGWDQKIHLFQKYQEQIKSALAKPTFSYPMSVTQQQGLPFGTPWANLPAFSDDQPDDDYPYQALNFDGAFEQPHDNYHGWVGPDMADNAYTAFDPVFLNFHANLDRIVESYIRSNPGLTFTSNYPLRPFTSMATSLDYREPREFMYTTIGDMAKPTQAIGYMYALPASPDSLNLQEMRARKNPLPFGVRITPAAAGLGGNSTHRPITAVASVAQKKKVPYVIFTDVACSTQSYQIDVFVQNASSLVPDPVINRGYIGRLTMLGMGPERAEKGQLRGWDRCGAPEQRSMRILEAERVSEALEGGENTGLKQVVTDLGSGEVVEERVWRQWKGFVGKLVWGNKEDPIVFGS
ncbi:hypothetical protein BDD12DRAFT_924420 [Trichophaea hybrida]|nr:hypothetical protein BDD12DRAFT_924420 [Trichophaea hybrida]